MINQRLILARPSSNTPVEQDGGLQGRELRGRDTKKSFEPRRICQCTIEEIVHRIFEHMLFDGADWEVGAVVRKYYIATQQRKLPEVSVRKTSSDSGHVLACMVLRDPRTKGVDA